MTDPFEGPLTDGPPLERKKDLMNIIILSELFTL